MAPHSSTLAWKIPRMEEPGGLQSMGSLESDMTERLHFHFSLSCTGEGNGNPLQCSCLEQNLNYYCKLMAFQISVYSLDLNTEHQISVSTGLLTIPYLMP